MSEPSLKVLLVGATGLVGRHCLGRLQADPHVGEIVVMQRASAPHESGDPRTRYEQIDFERIDAVLNAMFAVDAVIGALGTTIKVAGSQAAFRRVDHDYPVEIAAAEQREQQERGRNEQRALLREEPQAGFAPIEVDEPRRAHRERVSERMARRDLPLTARMQQIEPRVVERRRDVEQR